MPALVSTSVDPRYNPIIEFEGGWRCGPRVGPEALEQYLPGDLQPRAFQTSKHKAIPDFVIYHGIWMISEPVRDLIEALEPGVHAFHPMPLTNIAGNPADPPRYVLDIRQMIDPVILEQSTRSFADNGAYLIGDGSGLVLDKDAVLGKHVWRGRTQLMHTVFSPMSLSHQSRQRSLKSLPLCLLGLGGGSLNRVGYGDNI